MSVSPDVRDKLQALRIQKDQRPKNSEEHRGSRRFRRVVCLCVLLGLIGAGIYYSRDRVGKLFNKSEKTSEIRLIPITMQAEPDPTPVLIATGKIVSDNKVQVNTKVSGQIMQILYEQGDRVKQGQVLARIEDVNYRARRDQAAAELERAKASLAYHRINHERVVKLYEDQTAPPIELADAKRALEEAEALVAAGKAALDYTQKALNDCEVVAPIAGVILERNVSIGDFVAAEGGRGAMANAQLGSIADMQALRVEVDVSELDIARLRKDMPCIVTPDANKDSKFRGRVLWIDPGANYSKATVGVKVRIENPNDTLRVEGSAQVAFLPEEPRSQATTQTVRGIWIPASACLRDATTRTNAVFLVENGHLRKIPVTVGRESNGQLEITQGLSVGQSIAAGPLDGLRDGQKAGS